MRKIEPPKAGEYPAYAEVYMKHVPTDGFLLKHMKESFKEMKKLVLHLPEEKLVHRPEGKWTIKEILVHIVDDERIYAYRALRFARNDATELPGFEQDDYTRSSAANERNVKNILQEYSAVRSATIALFNGLPNEAFVRSGIANNNRATVRALAYHIAGHELHHIQLLKSQYL